jgi:8-oxo-dGTP pyrophosphatase MutT (NUDIX family)
MEPLHDHPAISQDPAKSPPCIGKSGAPAQASNAGHETSRTKRQGPRNVCLFEVSVTALQDLRKRLEPQLRQVFHLYWRVARGMTLGVRAVVLDGDNRVFLVRHSYVSGWYLPGGGVEVGETLSESLRRELMEEGRIELTGEPGLHGVFLNEHVSRRDHVAVYVIRQFRQDRLPEPNREIVECGFYDAGALPDDTTPGTRRRIAEVLDGKAPIATWR